MSTGSAIQSKLTFERKGQHDTAKAKKGNTSTRNDDDIEFESHATKRTHLQLEEGNTDHLELPDNSPRNSSSTGSMFSSDSTATIKDPRERGPREYRAPIVRSEDDTERLKIVRLERLKDKEDRYSSHISFLKECVEAKVIPKGLRIDLEPSIGNYDEAFCEKWYKR